MSIRILQPNETDMEKMTRMVKGAYRPPEIVKLKQEIEGAKRVAALHSSITGFINQNEIIKIVNMKLELDRLYSDWMTGKIE